MRNKYILRGRKLQPSFIFLITLLLLTLLFGNTFSGIPKSPKKTINYIDNFPHTLNNFSHYRDIGVDPIVIKALSPDGFLFRDYIENNRSQIVSMVLVYHERDRWGAHNPDGCYTSQGWTINKKDASFQIKKDKKILKVNKLIVEKKGAKDLVFYWFFDDTLQTSV